MMKKIKIINYNSNDLDSYEEECFIKIKKNPEFYGLLLDNGFDDSTIKKYIGSCNSYYDDYNVWKKLKTLSDIENSGIKYGYSLKIVDNALVRTSFLLPAYQDYVNFTSKFIYKDYSDSLNNVTLKNIDNLTLKSKVKSLIKGKSWIYFTGAMRSGRSYFAIALINASANKGSSNLAFIDCQSRFKEFSDYYFNNKQTFNNIIDKLKNAHVLVLDGFGNEYINDIVRDNIVLPILLYRANNQKTTIFTSDFSINDIVTLYATKNKSGNNIKVNQIGNILNSMIKNEVVTSKTSLY